MVFKPIKIKEEEEKPSLPKGKEEEIVELELALQKGLVSIQDLIAPASLKVTPHYLILGNTYARTIFVVAYPAEVSVGWFTPILNYPAQLDISMFFYFIPTAPVLKQLQRRVGTLLAEIEEEREKGLPRDPLKEIALKNIEKLRDDLTQGTEHYFQFSLYVTLYADSEKKLNELTEKIEGIFGSLATYTKRAFYQAEQGFNSTLPLALDELLVGTNMPTSAAASSFPFVSADLTSDFGILYGINRHNNSLIIFDRFSLENYNSTIFATSGAGKSYLVKLEVLRSMMLGTDVIIIDPEREYKHLSDAVGGTYIDVSLVSESKINPFDLPRPKKEMDVKVADIIRSAVATVKGLLKIMIGREEGGQKVFTPEEDSLLDRALLETYAKKDIRPGIDLSKLTPNDMPTLSDLQEILEGMKGAEGLVERLKKYTQGTFAGLLNHPTNVELDNQLVVFSIRDLEDELRPIAIYTIINYVWNIVRSEIKKRILVIDEAWWMMQYKESAFFLRGLVRRARKYYLGVTVITQDVVDFLASEDGRDIAAVTNSALTFLFKQTPAAIETVAKTFNLTEGEKYYLLNCGVGEGLIFAGLKHVAIQVVASYTEDQIITSDPRQLLEIEQAKKEFAESFEEMPEEEINP
jgi:type IV secretory pathway VirB4 component